MGVGLTSDSGYFYFFDPANIELVIKVLNGCGLNGHNHPEIRGRPDQCRRETDGNGYPDRDIKALHERRRHSLRAHAGHIGVGNLSLVCVRGFRALHPLTAAGSLSCRRPNGRINEKWTERPEPSPVALRLDRGRDPRGDPRRRRPVVRGHRDSAPDLRPTVHTHIKEIHKKLDVHSNGPAAALIRGLEKQG